MPAAVLHPWIEDWSVLMTAVMIGVDPHKGSHTAVAIGAAEEPLGDLRVGASAGQAQRLVTWATKWPERTWAVEGAGGLGHLLAQQLVAAWRAGAGRAAEAGRPGAAAGHRRQQQERPERCLVGGGRGAALEDPAAGER